MAISPLKVLIPARYAEQLGLRQLVRPDRVLPGGQRVMVQYDQLAALRLERAGVNVQLARELLGSNGQGKLTLEETSQLKQLLFEAKPAAAFQAEQRLFLNTEPAARAKLLTDLFDLKRVLGEAYQVSAAADQRDAETILPGDRVRPALGLSFDGKMIGADYREIEIKEFLLAVKERTFPLADPAERRQAVLRYFFQEADLAQFSCLETTLLAQLAFQAAGVPAKFIQGQSYKVSTQELKEQVWLELPVGGKETLVLDLFQRSSYGRPEIREIIFSPSEPPRRFFSFDDEHLHLYLPESDNRVHRPLSYLTAGAYEVLGRHNDGQETDVTLSLPGQGGQFLCGRSSRETRDRNEDRFLLATDGRRVLQVIADGMGGHPAGDFASSNAVQAMQLAFAEGASLLEAVEFTRFAVWAQNLRRPGGLSLFPGTTLVAALHDPDLQEVAIAGIGDSRAYRIREGQIDLLTLDQKAIAEFLQLPDGRPLSPPLRLGQDQIVVKGGLENGSRQYRVKSYYDYLNSLADMQLVCLTQVLGQPPPLAPPVIYFYDAQPGDVFLLASDGLNLLERDRLMRLVLSAAAAGAEKLVDLLFAEAQQLAKTYDWLNDNLTVTAEMIK